MPEGAPAHNDTQKQYWNANLDPQNLGRGEGENFQADRDFQFHFTPDQQYALSSLGDLNGLRVLDVGAGIGTNTLHMSSVGAQVVALDISHNRLVNLRQRAGVLAQPSRVFAVKAAAEFLPFRSDAFDVLYSKSVLIHTNLDQVIPELGRVLKPAGRGAFIEPLSGNPLVNVYRRTLAPAIWQSITRYFSDRELSLFRKTFPGAASRNFYVLSFAAFAFQFAIPAPRLFRWSLIAMHQVDSALVKLLPRVASRSWFTVITVQK